MSRVRDILVFHIPWQQTDAEDTSPQNFMGSHMFRKESLNLIPRGAGGGKALFGVLTRPHFGFQGLPRLPPSDSQDPFLMILFELESISLRALMFLGVVL